MNNYFELSDSDKVLLVKQTSERVNLNVEAVEKDLWVTIVLQTLFSLPYADKLVFKGGTSLSKIWNCISRFSEDVDIAIDRSIFGEEFNGDITKRQLKKLRKSASIYVRDVVCADLNFQV
ncbi:MAG: nucleotidyl transferase AbiEii/AbiGii toxin family protein [Rikenellaceae bacterium]